MAVVGDENNNFDVKIRDPPASFRSAVWQHFGFKVIVTDDKEVREKEKKRFAKYVSKTSATKQAIPAIWPCI